MATWEAFMAFFDNCRITIAHNVSGDITENLYKKKIIPTETPPLAYK